VRGARLVGIAAPRSSSAEFAVASARRAPKESGGEQRPAVRACVDVAAVAGVDVMLEPINRYEIDEGLQLIDEVGSPELRLLLDCFHMTIKERDLAATVRSVGTWATVGRW
jgi:hydroxypyruvate isomerase